MPQSSTSWSVLGGLNCLTWNPVCMVGGVPWTPQKEGPGLCWTEDVGMDKCRPGEGQGTRSRALGWRDLRVCRVLGRWGLEAGDRWLGIGGWGQEVDKSCRGHPVAIFLDTAGARQGALMSSAQDATSSGNDQV